MAIQRTPDSDAAAAPGEVATEPSALELKKFFELSTDLICVAGFDGRYRLVSSSCRQLLGFEPDEMLAEPFINRIHEDDLVAVQEALVQLSEGQPLTGFACRSRHKNGTYRWFYWSAQTDPESQLMYAVGRDITDAKAMYGDLVQQAQDLSTANSQLERANRMKSEFLANMSHELRTPLNAILGFTELLMDDPDAYDPATRASFLANVHESGRHLLGLVCDVLELAEVQAGRAAVSAGPFVIGELISEVVAQVKPVAAAKRIRLITEAEAVDVMVADRAKVRQVVAKLLSNALRFSPDGGEVRLRASQVGGEVTFSVTDSGEAIAVEDQAHLFELFHQLDSGADRRLQGIALALALIKAFTELHGGRLELKSQPNSGNTFTVTIPAVAVADLYAAKVAREMEPLQSTARDDDDRRPLVLIVDDEDQTARRVLGALEDSGYRWARAVDGQSALRKAQELKPAVITLDVMMPDLDGWQVLRLLKTHPATRSIPVVMVSRAENEVLGRALGAIDHVVKPVNPDALVGSLAGLSLLPRGTGNGSTRH